MLLTNLLLFLGLPEIGGLVVALLLLFGKNKFPTWINELKEIATKLEEKDQEENKEEGST